MWRFNKENFFSSFIVRADAILFSCKSKPPCNTVHHNNIKIFMNQSFSVCTCICINSSSSLVVIKSPSRYLLKPVSVTFNWETKCKRVIVLQILWGNRWQFITSGTVKAKEVLCHLAEKDPANDTQEPCPLSRHGNYPVVELEGCRRGSTLPCFWKLKIPPPCLLAPSSPPPQCWTLPVLGQWPKKIIWATKFFISVAQTHL